MYRTAKSLLFQTIAKIEGAYAPSTIRAYKTDFANYITFCESHDQEVFPPNPQILAEFINHLAKKGISSASIRRAIAGISTIYRLNRMPDPSKDPECLIAMKRMHRQLGRGAKQAQGITAAVLEKLISATDNSMRGIRNRALLLVAYDTLCRRSELVSLLIEDVRTMGDSGEKDITILLRRSKTDQEATGRWLHLSERAQNALRAWLTVLGENDGPLFRGIINNCRTTGKLPPGQVNRIYKNTARYAKLDSQVVERISGHSCRIGAAQDLVTSGASLPMIMSRGRWSKCDTVMRYVEHLDHRL